MKPRRRPTSRPKVSVFFFGQDSPRLFEGNGSLILSRLFNAKGKTVNRDVFEAEDKIKREKLSAQISWLARRLPAGTIRKNQTGYYLAEGVISDVRKHEPLVIEVALGKKVKKIPVSSKQISILFAVAANKEGISREDLVRLNAANSLSTLNAQMCYMKRSFTAAGLLPPFQKMEKQGMPVKLNPAIRILTPMPAISSQLASIPAPPESHGQRSIPIPSGDPSLHQPPQPFR